MELCMYEGYIRNLKQLLTELSVKEGKERRETEEKIILKGFERWGRDVSAHIYGSFSFVLRDKETESYFCVRDAFGIENLYYYITEDGEFLYSADIKNIIEDQAYSKEIDTDALQLYFMFGYPAGEKTLFKGIKKLLPGRSLSVKNGNAITKIWFKPEFVPDGKKNTDEWASVVEETFEKILLEDKQNIDLSECVSFLSGGVDSSYLLAVSGIKNAIGMDFEGGSIRESVFAKETADAYGASLDIVNITPEMYLEAIPGFIRCTELPVADPAGVAFFIGCKNIEKDKNIIFSGEGSDEFFAGYHVYKRLNELGSGGEPAYFGCDGVMSQKEAMRLLDQKRKFPVKNLLKDTFNPSEDCLSHMLSADIELWLEGDILLGAGRAARGCHKRAILPYADIRMFNISKIMPSEYKLRNDIGKYALRYAAKKKLPENTAFRKKAGYLVPVREWFRETSYRDRIKEVIFGEKSRLFFDEKVLSGYWERYLEGGFTEFRIVFAVYIFLIWFETVFNN